MTIMKKSMNSFLSSLLQFTYSVFIILRTTLIFHGQGSPMLMTVDAAFAFNNKVSVPNNISKRKLCYDTSLPYSSQESTITAKNLVLIGGGHAHLQVIKAFNKKARPKDVHVTLIDMQSFASYSGMVPGCIAKLYKLEETQIDLVGLSNWAGIDFIRDAVTSVDPKLHLISLKNGTMIKYDVLSIDIGSSSRGVHTIPGVNKYTIPTRPISSLLSQIENQEEMIIEKEELKYYNNDKVLRLVVIGGGLAGIELSLALNHRWKTMFQDKNLEVTILNSGTDLLPNETSWCREAIYNVLRERCVKVRHGCYVSHIDDSVIHLRNGEDVPYTHCLWATGAESHPLAWEIKAHGIAVNDNGWIQVRPTLQSISHSNIFAAGDCASIESPNFDSPSKAGVYAVRSGPILVDNISKVLNGFDDYDQLISYVPQEDFLKLIVCGDGTALGFRFGIPLEGKWVWQLKDKIDTTFMDLFRVEILPRLEGDNDDTYTNAQYDERTTKVELLEPEVGAMLLLSKDKTIDYEQAWNVLRDMMDDINYREEVLRVVSKQRLLTL